MFKWYYYDFLKFSIPYDFQKISIAAPSRYKAVHGLGKQKPKTNIIFLIDLPKVAPTYGRSARGGSAMGRGFRLVKDKFSLAKLTLTLV